MDPTQSPERSRSSRTPRPLHTRLPFYFGWVIVGIAFVTMAVSVSARTAFSLFLPPLIAEYDWDLGLVAGAFSFGFMISAFLGPVMGRAMDRFGPRPVMEAGALILAAGLFLAPQIAAPWQLYLTLGGLVGVGANLMSFTAQSLYLPNWFVRHRGLAVSIAFSGVGVGALILLPWLQTVIESSGWREACRMLGLIVIVILVPLNLLVRKHPRDLGLEPDGQQTPPSADEQNPEQRSPSNIVDHEWAATEWTLARALRTSRFWMIGVGFFFALIAWYAVQVHQTKYLTGLGYDPLTAAYALGFVSIVAIPGQIGFGALSDRIGREWIWSVGCGGFAVCYATLVAMEHWPSPALLYLMVLSQGFFGYALTSVMGAMVLEIFEGPHYGTIFGTITMTMIGGGAFGPWAAGVIHDATGSYQIAFSLAIICCLVSTVAIWLAAPRKVRAVRGRIPS